MQVALYAALAALALLWSVMLLSVLLDRRALADLPRARPPERAPRVAAIVPARDEAHQIERCLRSLLSQDWPDLRVVCVDDRSSDGTGDIAERIAAGDPRLTVVRGSELPPGWLGKNHANAQGVRAAGPADWYLFTDADTAHAPHALPTAWAAAQRASAALLTLVTRLELHGFWDRAVLTNVIATIVSTFPAWLVNDPRSTVAIANGQYLLVRRDAYEAAGGHAAIRDRVADDLELARLLKRAGFTLRAEGGLDLVSVRMYRSLREIWWGFVKNASAGAGGPALALLGALLVLASALPFFALPWALWTQQRGLAALAAAGTLAAVAQRAYLYRALFGLGVGWALLLPLAQLMFAGIVVHSAARHITGRGPVWKGRTYPRAR